MTHIFISYSKKNSDYAYELADYLQDQGFNIWIDRIGIEYGVGWWDAIVDGLHDCGAFIVVMTPEAKQSDWVQREVFIALQDKKAMFPILLNGDNWEVFVLTQYADLSNGDLPDADLIRRLGEHVTPRGKGSNQSDLTPEKQKAKPIAPQAIRFDVDNAIAEFFKAYRVKDWSEGLDILGRLRASDEDTAPFNVDEFEGQIHSAIETEKREREQEAYEAERDRQYERVKMIATHADDETVWTTLQRFWETFPDFDPDNIAGAVRPKPKAPQSNADAIRANDDAIRAIIGEPFEWCEVPAGDFLYGEDKRTLNLPAFAMAKYPITYSQYQVFVKASDGLQDTRWWQGLAQTKNNLRNQKWKIANHPRETVSWYDSMAFSRWLSWKLGGEYAIDKLEDWLVRLPTEFEWEKSARGTNGLIYPYGNQFDKNKSNTKESEIEKTTPVTQYPQGASPYGVLDMSGNVREWCLSDHKNPQEDAIDENISSNSRRVLRGGSWDYFNFNARAVFRSNHYSPSNRYSSFGFRLCRPLRAMT